MTNDFRAENSVVLRKSHSMYDGTSVSPDGKRHSNVGRRLRCLIKAFEPGCRELSLISPRLIEFVEPLFDRLNSLQNNLNPFQRLLRHAVRIIDAAGHGDQSFGECPEFGGHVRIVDEGLALADVVITHNFYRPPLRILKQ